MRVKYEGTTIVFNLLSVSFGSDLGKTTLDFALDVYPSDIHENARKMLFFWG